MIPAIEGTRGEAVILTTPLAVDRTAYRDVSAVNAIKASAAAPKFFEEKTIIGLDCHKQLRSQRFVGQ